MQIDIIGWLSQNKTWVFSGIGVAIPIAAISWWLSRRSASRPSQRSGAGSQNLQAARDINVSISTPTPAIPGTQTSVAEPRILVRDARRTRIILDETQQCFVESVPEGNMAALVAFRNRSEVTAKNVVATIEYISILDSQMVLHGVWLNNAFSTQWIEPGMTEQLLVAAYCNDEHQYYTFDCQQHDTVQPPAVPIPRLLSRGIYDVTVTLSVTGKDHLFKFTLNLEEFQFEYRGAA
jgi:hypothetical protein